MARTKYNTRGLTVNIGDVIVFESKHSCTSFINVVTVCAISESEVLLIGSHGNRWDDRPVPSNKDGYYSFFDLLGRPGPNVEHTVLKVLNRKQWARRIEYLLKLREVF